MTTKQRRPIRPQAFLNDDAQILWFDDLGTGNEQARFLSNFYQGAPLTVPGVLWRHRFEEQRDHEGHLLTVSSSELPADDQVRPVEFATGEHAFAALKTIHPDWFYVIATAADPNEAKALGRSCPLRRDWEAIKLDVMAAIIRSKFTLDREEGELLLGTGDKYLAEGTYWHDRVWGVDLTATDSFKTVEYPGRNWLGTLLMARRAELRAQHLLGASILDTGRWNAEKAL
jgi:ribA/ribD-fused uncharacterized protein